MQQDITKKQYTDYLIFITKDYMSSGLAENLDKANDNITDNLKSENLIAQGSKELAAKLLHSSATAFMPGG